MLINNNIHFTALFPKQPHKPVPEKNWIF